MARPKGYKFKFKIDRTTKFTPDTLNKLEEGAAHRLSDKGTSAHAKISRDTFYRWLKEIPGLSDRLDDLRELPITRSKRNIVSRLDSDVNVAFKYLEKEKPDEYGERLNVKDMDTSTDSEEEGIRLKHKKAYLDDIKANIHRRAREEHENKKREAA